MYSVAYRRKLGTVVSARGFRGPQEQSPGRVFQIEVRSGWVNPPSGRGSEILLGRIFLTGEGNLRGDEHILGWRG